MADETTVGLRNVCPANITYDLPEFGLSEVKPGDVIQVPPTDFDRFPETVWAPADEAAGALAEQRAFEAKKTGEDIGEPRTEIGGDTLATEPPRGGAGSGKDAWLAYAAAVGVEVDDDADRDAVIAAVDAATEKKGASA